MEIHKPKAAHSWGEFLIEIGTIICGIVIALGLEQAVEYGHKTIQVREAREALTREHKHNLEAFQILTDEQYVAVPAIRQDILLFSFLSDHPKSNKWPFNYIPLNVNSVLLLDSAWRNAEQSNIIQYFPIKEAEQYRREYAIIEIINKKQIEELDKVYSSRRPIIEAAASGRFAPDQIHEELNSLSDLMLLYTYVAQRQRNLSERFNEYKHAPDDRFKLGSTFNISWLDSHRSSDLDRSQNDSMNAIYDRLDKLYRKSGLK